MNGYTNAISMKSLTDNDICDLEKFAQHIRCNCNENYGINIPDDEMPLLVGLYAKNEQNFKFEPGHKATLRGIVESLKSGNIPSVNLPSIKKKNHKINSVYTETSLGVLFGSKHSCNASMAKKSVSENIVNTREPSEVTSNPTKQPAILHISNLAKQRLHNDLSYKLSSKLSPLVTKSTSDLGAITFQIKYEFIQTTDSDTISITGIFGQIKCICGSTYKCYFGQKKEWPTYALLIKEAVTKKTKIPGFWNCSNYEKHVSQKHMANAQSLGE